jgi:hypothetical protein
MRGGLSAAVMKAERADLESPLQEKCGFCGLAIREKIIERPGLQTV